MSEISRGILAVVEVLNGKELDVGNWSYFRNTMLLMQNFHCGSISKRIRLPKWGSRLTSRGDKDDLWRTGVA
jgi:hypothetical protein